MAEQTLTEFLLARIAEDDENAWCEGSGEYRGCRDWSERRSAECDAKRQIIHLHRARSDEDDPAIAPWCASCGTPYEWPTDYPCPTLRLLALPYAAHPDYRQEWTP